MAAAASAAFLCCCERKYRGVKAGEGGERRKGRSAEEDGRKWGWRGGKRENGTGEQRTKRTKEKKTGGGRDAGKKKNGPRQAATFTFTFTFTLGLLATHNVQGAAANLPRDWSGVKWVCTKGWLSTLLGLNSPPVKEGPRVVLFTFYVLISPPLHRSSSSSWLLALLLQLTLSMSTRPLTARITYAQKSRYSLTLLRLA